jgi:hypothetical protein
MITLPILEGSTPRHQVTVQSLLTVGRGVQIDPTYRYVSAREAMSIPSYHTADLRIGATLSPGFELSLGRGGSRTAPCSRRAIETDLEWLVPAAGDFSDGMLVRERPAPYV